MNYSDSSDSDPDTGRFKSSKKKEISRQYKLYEENKLNYQIQMPVEEKKLIFFRSKCIAKREESKNSQTRDSEPKKKEFTEETSDNMSTTSSNRPKESRKTELNTITSSSKQYVKRRRTRSIDRNCAKLINEKNEKYNSQNNTMFEHNRNQISEESQEKNTNNRIKSRDKIEKNSRERDTQYSRHSSKNQSLNRLQEKEMCKEKKSLVYNKPRSKPISSHSNHPSDSSYKTKSLNENISFGPALPPVETYPNEIVGPVLPSGLKFSSCSSLENVQEEPKKTIGPQIPRNMIEQIQFQAVNNFDKFSASEEEEDCSFTIGPMPAGSITLSAAQLELEKRALEIKIKKLDEADMGSSSKIEDEREEWMIELPEIRKVADLGLGARQFRTKERPDFDDRTQWTSTPHIESSTKKKEQKIDLQKAQEKLLQAARDREQDIIAINHKKKSKRDSSLMDIHKKKLKKENVNNVIQFLLKNFYR